jgi:hypothetical protein
MSSKEVAWLKALNKDQLRLVLSRPDGAASLAGLPVGQQGRVNNPDAENETDTVEHSRETLR